MKTEWIYLLIFVLAVAAVSGCTTSGPAVTPTAVPTTATPMPPTPTAATTAEPGSATPSPTTTAPSTASVTISNFAFQPDNITVAKGGTVTWTNNDATAHTVKFEDSQSAALQKDATYNKTFDTVGTFDYSCGIHPSMKGKVVVV